MAKGRVSSGNFSKGTPITLPHEFGTPVNLPEPQGNVIPQANPRFNSNQVTWAKDPAHFGNGVGFSIQSVPPIIIVQAGGTASVNINVTALKGSPSVTLTAQGAPTGMDVSFAPNPTTGTQTAVAEISVDAAVATGKYTVTVQGVSGTETEHTNIHVVVVGNSQPINSFGFELEDGSGVILLEDGSILLLENQS